MGLFKTALIGAAVYGAIKYITKKDVATGKSIADEIQDKAPEWIEKAKTSGRNLGDQLNKQGL